MKKKFRVKIEKRNFKNKMSRLKHFMIVHAKRISSFTTQEEKDIAIDKILKIFPEISETDFLKLIDDFASRPPKIEEKELEEEEL